MRKAIASKNTHKIQIMLLTHGGFLWGHTIVYAFNLDPVA
jgi:hypothetical protein